ncbi:hypothetical protein BJ508DRAFT_326130 [Ascobolus immersus RN42]|uniref:Uncharacterized protein n=1 Tax=Ascobolus immersus RN42 TaxID=1160509 RepID=A0A3N4IAG6_ASCIM|nr:hypothetical protein BJ508DRAFT_326130 [Ascobolus immersus RN42]
MTTPKKTGEGSKSVQQSAGTTASHSSSKPPPTTEPRILSITPPPANAPVFQQGHLSQAELFTIPDIAVKHPGSRINAVECVNWNKRKIFNYMETITTSRQKGMSRETFHSVGLVYRTLIHPYLNMLDMEHLPVRMYKGQLSPIPFTLKYGKTINCHSIYCAILAILSQLVLPPSIDWSNHHLVLWAKYAVAMASNWLYVFAGQRAPRVANVTIGVTESGTVVVMFGSTKAFGSYGVEDPLPGYASGIKYQWTEKRELELRTSVGEGVRILGPRPLYSEFVEIPPAFKRGYSSPTSTNKAAVKVISEERAKKRAQDARSIFTERCNRCLKRTVKEGDINTYEVQQSIGDCAETVPLQVAAQTCSGLLLSFSAEVNDVRELVNTASGPVDYSRVKIKDGCCNCAWLFTYVETKEGMVVAHRSQILSGLGLDERWKLGATRATQPGAIKLE